jgi:lysozyme family protein
VNKVFQCALEFVFDAEGGYTNDSNDPGGETNFGIDKRSHPNEDIKKLTKERAAEIYYNDYWLKSCAEHLPKLIAIAYFDSAVNTGIKQANRFLQRAVSVKDDGVIGPVTLNAVTHAEPKSTANRLIDFRQTFYNGLADSRPKLRGFLKGWTNRNTNLKAFLAKNIT